MAQRNPNPLETGPKPPFDQPPQEPPGTEAEMSPKADHGEETYRGLARLTDRAAIVTGADSGIGRAAALAFAREGADVLISYLSEDEDAAETRLALAQAGVIIRDLPARGLLRASVGAWNDTSDIERLLAALE